MLTLVLIAAVPSATGICDASASAPQACLDAVQNAGAITNDVFHDANGLTAAQLPLFGSLTNTWPGCDTVNHAGCSGQSSAPFDCPGQYACTGATNAFANASSYLNGLDRLWWDHCRLADHTVANACPAWSACVADGAPGSYLPWEGLVFNLGAAASKVVVFGEIDHGPQPCESLEYTVFLSDDPFARELAPSATIDPARWNRATLSRVFSRGWLEVRAPDAIGHAACGDTAQYSVEMDAMTQVFSLPAGAALRYAAVVPGNDGLDFPECGFDSQDAELDAVAGLTEAGTALCPDGDADGASDCSCPGAPVACDCDDADPAIHPGAFEACDGIDNDCDATIDGASCDDGNDCTDGDVCVDSVCAGATPRVCVPLDDCHEAGTCAPVTGTCDSPNRPDGSACSLGTCAAGVCVPPAAPGGTPDHGCSCGAGSSVGWLALAVVAAVRRRRP